MKKMIWLTSFFVLFLVFIVPGILAMGIKMTPANDQPGYNSNQRLSIYGKREVSQKFISKNKNLTAVGTSIRNPNLKNKKGIIFNLHDGKDILIRTSLLSGLNIEDGDFVKFVFEPITDSENKEYSFTLSTPEAGAEETIEVFYIEDEISGILEYVYDEKTYPGGVPMVTFHKPEGKWSVVREVYANWFSRLLRFDSRKI